MKNDMDVYLFHRGEHRRAYEFMGAHKKGKGAIFRVWAPKAQSVQLVGDFNSWTGIDMRKKNNEGIWEIEIPKVSKYDKYKYRVLGADGITRDKADPYGICSELRPKTASVYYDKYKYNWGDREWVEKREYSFNRPLNIYEVHLGSWMKAEDGEFLNYRDLAIKLCKYVKEMNYNYIELMPINEYPLDASWGYQGTGFFAVTSRYGTPEDFMFFVDHFHQNNIGIILDWVPGHFCKDEHGLYMFDGTPTYEYGWDMLRENEGWGTANFDFSRNEVRSFLISNALFWLREFHIDGLRVDAVANMLYLDFGKDGHPELKNQYGNNVNIWAVDFIKALNYAIKEEFPKAIICAEDSTAWPNVTKSETEGGLGFSYKWNMGWMNDTLKYMKENPMNRGAHHGNLTFSLMYAFSENYILSFSHDEVVHGKNSMINKMPGDLWQKFSNLRVLYSYMMTHPGKKLTFMGNEFGHYLEWRFYESLEWYQLDNDLNWKMREYVKDLNKFYMKQKSLWEKDGYWDTFQWIDHSNSTNSIISFIRRAEDRNEYLIVVLNFSGIYREKYRVGVPNPKIYKEIFNSDLEKYGGTGHTNNGDIKYQEMPWNGFNYSVEIDIPAFSAIVLKTKYKSKSK